uniref:Protein Tat n=1 Tax=Simian immunodeficiency virus TaxID=11723 RepID=A0A7D6GMP1_SIV|nr:tat protein [Simian immunodeficiency virus]
METPLREQENSLKSSNEHSSCISEVDATTPESANLGEEILSQLYRPLKTCYNTYYYKKCYYHCQFYFLKKDLKICYEQSRKRRRTPKKAKANTSSASNNRLIPSRTRHCQSKKTKKKTVKKAVATAPGLGK